MSLMPKQRPIFLDSDKWRAATFFTKEIGDGIDFTARYQHELGVVDVGAYMGVIAMYFHNLEALLLLPIFNFCWKVQS